MDYPIHTVDTAPDAAKEILAGAQQAYGFVPNLLGTMAEAPALLKAYTTISRIFDESSFTPTERQVVLLATSVQNGCRYCVAAHSAIASMQRVPAEVVTALRDGETIPDAKLEALREFATSVVSSRGWPSEQETERFTKAGCRRQQVLEVVLGIGLKTLSNYTNHLASTPLDAAFTRAAWAGPASAAPGMTP